ncbi:MAG: DUF6788 family protein [Gemmatimonadales bacterium]
MPKSRAQLLASLRELHQERQRLIRRLIRGHELALGTVSVVRRKCGNPSCHCSARAGHPQTLFLFTDPKDGRRRCKLVRRADEARLLRAGRRYRHFRQDLSRLRAIDRHEKGILTALMRARAIRYE